MSVAKKLVLSGSTDGEPILVNATVIGSGDTIHTVGALTTSGHGEEVQLFAYNSHNATVTLKVGLGGVTEPNHVVAVSIPQNEMYEFPPWFGKNSKIVKASCDVSDKVIIWGHALQVA